MKRVCQIDALDLSFLDAVFKDVLMLEAVARNLVQRGIVMRMQSLDVYHGAFSSTPT